jgi:hypothetical protein
VKDPHAEDFGKGIEGLNYPRWWLEMVGFWGQPGVPATTHISPQGIRPVTFNTLSSQEAYAKAFPDGGDTRYFIQASTAKPLPEDQQVIPPAAVEANLSETIKSALLVGVGVLVGLLMSMLSHKFSSRAGYREVGDLGDSSL